MPKFPRPTLILAALLTTAGATALATRKPTSPVPSAPVAVPAPVVSPSTLEIALVCHRETVGGTTHSGATRCDPAHDPICAEAGDHELVTFATDLHAAGIPVAVYSDPAWVQADALSKRGTYATLSALGVELGCHSHAGVTGIAACRTALGALDSGIIGGAIASDIPALWAAGGLIQGPDAGPGHPSTGPRLAGLYAMASAADWSSPAAPGTCSGMAATLPGTSSAAKAVSLARAVALGQPITDAVTGKTVLHAYVEVGCDPAELPLGDVGISAGDTAAKLIERLGEAGRMPGVTLTTPGAAAGAWRLRGCLDERWTPTTTVHGG